ncbi:MAG: PIN domain-containing protein [Cyclobacteriaceae bacterium]
MTRIFLDANVLISVVNQELPLFTFSSRILSLVDDSRFEVYTSPLCLAITYYFSEKKSGSKLANKKLRILSERLNITTVNPDCVTASVNNPKVSDFEDGLQYYSTVASGCEMIITENQKDFYFSEITVTDCEGFFVNHLKNK